MNKIKRKNTYANCVGYAFSQCYDSDIEILISIENDEQQLQQLKALIAEYEQALEIVDDEATLMWPISKTLIETIKKAATLKECYEY